MKILFKQKQWVVIQAIFAIIGVMVGIAIKAQTKEPVGGLALGLDFLANVKGSNVQILFALLSDLLFNVEYVQGTFLTHLLCGQSRKVWMLKKSITFYIFVFLQLFIVFVLISLVTSVVLGHFGLQGLKETLHNMKTIEVVEGIGANILRTLMFVSFAVFATTLLPGKLVIGGIASMGAILVMTSVTQTLYQAYKDSKVIDFAIHNFSFGNPTKFTWVLGILWVLIFTWLSMERIKRVEIASRGA